MNACGDARKEWDIVICFFIFQDIGDPPRVTKYPFKDHLVMEHAPQSASQQDTNYKSKSHPISDLALDWLLNNVKTHLTIAIWSSLEFYMN